MEIDREKEIREYLPQIVHMSLATVKDNKPWVCEVHFAYDEDLNLYFRSLTSRRHSQEIAENSRVAGNIIRQHSLEEVPAGVYFEGTARKLEAGDEQNKAAGYINQRLQSGDHILEEAKHADGHQFYKVIIENFYLFDGVSGQKYELAWNGGKRD